MTKKTITLPAGFLYSMEYDVLYSDVKSADHMGADRVLPVAMEAQLRFLKQLGYTDASAFEDAGLIMAHSEVQYLAEAKYGDRLKIELAANNIQTRSFELAYRITNLTKATEMARLVTTLLFFDYREKRVVAVPTTFTELLDAFKP